MTDAPKIYIAGPMTGLPENNHPAFLAAAEQLRAAGFEPIHPPHPEGREAYAAWRDFMRAGLPDLITADGVATLPGWRESKGASFEVDVARIIGLRILPVDLWATAPPDATLPEGAAG